MENAQGGHQIYNLARVQLSDDEFRSAGNSDEFNHNSDTVYTMGFINGKLFLGGDIDCAKRWNCVVLSRRCVEEDSGGAFINSIIDFVSE